MTDFKLLGTLEVIHNGLPCSPSAPKVRQVLALLLTNVNQVVHMDTLIEELWGDDPPTSAVTTTQTYIYQLRKLFQRNRICGLTGDPLITEHSGYVLRVDPDNIDAETFLSGMRRGRALLRAGAVAEAKATLHGALGLWRGPVFVNMDCGRILQSHAVFLGENQIRTREMLISAELALGHHREVVAELQSLVREYPLNEWFHARLIEALHRSDRRSEALQTFDNLRLVLRNELGLDPSAEVVALQADVLGGASSAIGPHDAHASRSGGGY